MLRPVPKAPRVDLTGTKVLVTGAADGSIGGETARGLTEWGAQVVTTTRTCPVTATAHPLDLSIPASVQAFADWFAREHGRLDVLVNNAGVHLDLLGSWKEPHRGTDGHELHWRTNYLGTMHLTHLLLPYRPRVVNVVSRLHTRGTNASLFTPKPRYSSWDMYGNSKLALVHATKELVRRGYEAYSLHPGEVYTHIADTGLSDHPVLGRIRKRMAPLERLITMTPVQGAQTSLFVASQSGLQAGAYYAKCAAAKEGPEAADVETSGRLWRETEEWVRGLT